MHSTHIIFLLIAVVFVVSTTAKTVNVELAVAELEPFGGGDCDLDKCEKKCRKKFKDAFKKAKCVKNRCKCYKKISLEDMLDEVEENWNEENFE
jgi:hypothetical protein